MTIISKKTITIITSILNNPSVQLTLNKLVIKTITTAINLKLFHSYCVVHEKGIIIELAGVKIGEFIERLGLRIGIVEHPEQVLE